MFNNLDCWAGMHLLYATVGIISSIIFIPITLIITSSYFENRQLSGNILTKVNARCELINQFSKIVTCFFFTVLVSSDFQWTLIIILFFGSLVIFFNFQNSEAYLCYKVHVLWKLYSGVYFWTCFILFFVKLFEDTDFEGGVFTWLIGALLMGLIVAVNLNTYASILL